MGTPPRCCANTLPPTGGVRRLHRLSCQTMLVLPLSQALDRGCPRLPGKVGQLPTRHKFTTVFAIGVWVSPLQFFFLPWVSLPLPRSIASVSRWTGRCVTCQLGRCQRTDLRKVCNNVYMLYRHNPPHASASEESKAFVPLTFRFLLNTED